MKHQHYQILAELFDYPNMDFPDKAKLAFDFFEKDYPRASFNLHEFNNLLPFTRVDEPLKEMQELFTKSFDVQAITTLGIGYILFGDDYKRGELLVHLNREHRQVQNDCGCELSDHLPNILRLLPKLEDQALVEELVTEIIVPALKKMILEFDPGRLKKKKELYMKHYKTLIESTIERETIYAQALNALFEVFCQDFDLPTDLSDHSMSDEYQNDFFKKVEREINIEDEAVKPEVKGASWSC